MSSSIFGRQPQTQMTQQIQNNSLQALANSMRGINPQTAYNLLISKNKNFAKFVKENQGKSVEQIAKENGLDYSAISNFIHRF